MLFIEIPDGDSKMEFNAHSIQRSSNMDIEFPLIGFYSSFVNSFFKIKNYDDVIENEDIKGNEMEKMCGVLMILEQNIHTQCIYITN